MKHFAPKLSILIAFVSLLVAVSSCKRDAIESTTNGTNITNMNDLKIPNGFNFQTTRAEKVSVKILNPQGDVYKNIIVSLMSNSIELGGRVLAKGVTDANGMWETTVEVPLILTSLVINTSASNIPRDVIVSNAETVFEVLGGPNYRPVTVVNPITKLGKTSFGKLPGKVSTRLGTWNTSTGKPNYLETNDVVSNTFLNNINSFLQNGVNFPNRYPTLLDDNFYKRNIVTTGVSDVYITFVKEGAGYKNTLFYYTYNVNNPPTNASDIDSLIVIYPNTSFAGSGGDLSTGNKVKIGTFGKDTVIAFGIIADGFNASDGTINSTNTNPVYFGNKNFNPETNSALRQHLVFVYEPSTERFVLAFEDLNRENGADNDFDDVVYYASVSDLSKIDLDKVCNVPSTTDTDGDGVDDLNDDYPTDGNKAFNNFYPASNKTASVAYEDLWYFKGDYDMNDVVMDMQTNAITNAHNKVVRFEAKYCLRASGGSLRTAFAIQYPVERTKISNIVGGTIEGDKANAVIKLYDDVRQHQLTWNTVPNVGYNDSVNFNLSFNFTDSVSLTDFGVSLHDPFVWINETGKGRNYEIHLPGKSPTSTASNSLFGLGDDDTQIFGVKKYLSKNNLPWAIAIPERFEYPYEQQNITQAYLNFAAWSQSGGTTNKDWYYNVSGYRNNSKIYVRP